MRHIRFAVVVAAFSLLASQGLAQRGSNTYIVILKEPPLAESVASRKELSNRSASVQKQSIIDHQSELGQKIKSAGGRVVDSTQLLLNALFVEASNEQVEAMKAMPGVDRIQRMQPLKRHINKALDLVNVRTAWSQVGGIGSAGSGIKIAILDTGIDQDHPAFRNFSATPPAGYPKCRTDNGDCSFTNNKVIAARSYVDLLNFAFGTDPVNTRPDDNTPRDRIGHGTATAMVAAGQEHDAPIGRISGVAPRAFLGNYKVFGSRGVNDTTYPSVVLKAMEDALADGMDIVALNLGAPAGYGPQDNFCGQNANQPCDAFASAVQNAVRLGMIVTVSAGNSGAIGANLPSLNTIESPGTAPAAITVGASTNSHIWYNTLTVLGNGVPTELQNVNMRFSDGPQISAPIEAQITDVGSVGSNRLACVPLPDNSLAGRIALVERGSCALALKVNHAQRAGAIAVVITGLEGGGVFQLGGLDDTAIPSALIGFNAGNSLRSFLSNQPRNVRLSPSFREVAAAADEIAEFSSQGPAIATNGVKPDLVAVGTDLYMATQNTDPNGEMFNPNGYVVAQGTSFSGPMAAGAAALVKQRSSSLRPAQVKSALVNTANPNLTDFDSNGRSVQAAITAMGSGKLDANRALQANVAVEPSSIGFGVISTGTLPTQGLVVSNLAASGSLNLGVRIEPRNGSSSLTVAVTPTNFALVAGRETQLTVRLTGTRPTNGKYDGFIVITGGATEIRVPYTFFVGPSAAWNMYALAGSFFDAIPAYRQSVLVKIVDQFGIPVPNVLVSGRVTSGNGSVSFVNENARRTDEYGIVEASFVVGSNIGEQVARFEAGNLFADFVANVIPRPAVSTNGVRDAASGEASEAFAPGQYISIFGASLSPALKVFSGNQLPLSLSRVSVSFDNPSQRVSAAGRLQFVSDGQINVQIPWECAGLATVDMKVSIGEFSSAVQTLRLRDANPAPFEYVEAGSNRRYVAALDGAFGLISSANPVRRGQVAQLYVNGLGPVTNTPGSGQVSPASPLATTVNTPQVLVGNRPAQILFSGLAPGIVGLYQVNIVVPADAPTGPEVELSIRQSGVTARSSRIAVQ
jgi:minor extracellular serine protease Vpr